MKLILFLFLAIGSLASAAFVPPNDGPVPFRRDKLPVDVDTMVALSNQLVVLARATDVGKPEEARRAAQILGLSLALDPTNRPGLDLAKRLKNGNPVEPAGSNAVSQAKSRAWHLLGWLEQPEAGADGNALAACLADILEGVDPDHPRAVELAGKAEQGKWAGWVAAVDAFKDAEPDIASNNPDPDTPTKPETSAAVKLASASVKIPLWFTDKVTKKLVLRPMAIKMAARIEEGDKKLRVKLPEGRNRGEMEKKVSEGLAGFLKERHGDVPAGLRYQFSIEGNLPYSETRNGNAWLGAMLVLADSALSGVAPEGVVLAEPVKDGSLKAPAKFWQTIRVLADHEPGARLIIPSSAKEFMPALITLGKSDFFMNFEVVLAKDVEKLCELASSSPPEKAAAAHAAFEMIRKARGTRSLGGFLSHDSTQQRLKQVVELSPGHLSARMLALRGTSQWPKRLSREIYSREIRAAVEPFDSTFKPGGWLNLDGKALAEKVSSGKEQLAEVEKLFGSVGDRQELHAPAMNLLKVLGGLATDARRSGDFDESRYKLESAYTEAWKEYVGLVRTLTFAAGDMEEYPVPEVKKSN